MNAFWSKPIWIMNEKRSICPSHQDMTTTPRLPCWRPWKNRWENMFLTCSWEKVIRKLSDQNCPFLIVESFAGDICRALGIYDGYTLNRACQEASLLENGNSFRWGSSSILLERVFLECVETFLGYAVLVKQQDCQENFCF